MVLRRPRLFFYVEKRIQVGDADSLITRGGLHLLTGHAGKGQQFDRMVVSAPMTSDDARLDRPKFLLDGCAVDPLLDDPDFAKLVSDLVHSRSITIYITDLTLQDINAVPDRLRRVQLQAIVNSLETKKGPLPAVLVSQESKHGRPTYPGEVYPVSEEDWELLGKLKVDDRADARQALAAKWCDAALVTNDKRLIKRASEQNIEAITTEQWRVCLEKLDSIG